MDCIFCRIADGSLPANIVYEDEDVVAFRDINPVAPVHMLVIPRKHIASVNALEEQDALLAGKLLLTARRLAAEQGFAENGFRLVMNTNQDAGQTVFHMHLHVLAGRYLAWPPG
ncbi:MAG: histidine triad nucleotide-binding protein [Thiohalomonadaceae bacterium]